MDILNRQGELVIYVLKFSMSKHLERSFMTIISAMKEDNLSLGDKPGSSNVGKLPV